MLAYSNTDVWTLQLFNLCIKFLEHAVFLKKLIYNILYIIFFLQLG